MGGCLLCQALRQSARWYLFSFLYEGMMSGDAQKCVRQLVAELREFQRKLDYQYKHEPRGPECSAPQRAIRFFVGPRADLAGFATLKSAGRTQRQR